MSPDEAAERIASLTKAGYLRPTQIRVPSETGGQKLLDSEDEFVVVHPAGRSYRPEVLAALRREMSDAGEEDE